MMIFVFALSNKSVCVEMCVYCIITDHLNKMSETHMYPTQNMSPVNLYPIFMTDALLQ